MQNIESIHELGDALQTKAFLGREFLTWLWWKIETDGSSIDAGGDLGSVEMWVADKVVFVVPGMDQQVQTLKGGDPSRTLEASAALLTGKMVKELRVGSRIDSDVEIGFTLKAPGLSPSGIKVVRAADMAAEDIIDDSDRTISDVETIVNLTDGLFELFLTERTNRDWEKSTLSTIRSWVQDRKERRSKYYH